MSLKSIFSSISKKSSQTHESHSQCRYILDSGPRCRRQPSVTGSGLCIHHENEILNLRRDDSQDLAAQALSGVSDFTSALNINHVAGRILTLALQRRYTTRELDSFTRSLRLLLKSQPDAAFEQSLAKWRTALASHRHPEDRPEPSNATNRETVAPNSSSAVLAQPNSTTQPESCPSVAVVSGETRGTEEAPESTDTANPKTVAPNSTLHRGREGSRTCAATCVPEDSTAQPEPRPAATAAGFTPQGFAKAETQNALSDSNRATVAPNSGSAAAERQSESPNMTEPIKNRPSTESSQRQDDSSPTRRPCYTYQEAFAETLRQCRLTDPDLPDYKSDDIAVHNAEFHEKKPDVQPVKFGFRYAGPPRPRRKG